MGDEAPGVLVTGSGITVPGRALAWRFSRSSGPGGQHVNKADTRVELICDLTELGGPPEVLERLRSRLGDSVRVVAASERSQLANRQEATRRLLARLDSSAKVKARRRPTRPGRGAVEARLSDKRRQAQRKADRRPHGDD